MQDDTAPLRLPEGSCDCHFHIYGPFAAPANAANSFSSSRPSFANAQAMLAMPCAVTSLKRRCASLANAAFTTAISSGNVAE